MAKALGWTLWPILTNFELMAELLSTQVDIRKWTAPAEEMNLSIKYIADAAVSYVWPAYKTTFKGKRAFYIQRRWSIFQEN